MPHCLAETKDLGSEHPCHPCTGESILKRIKEVGANVGPDASTWAFISKCTKRHPSGVEHLFWEGMESNDICKVICNDVLLPLCSMDYCTMEYKIIGEQEIERQSRQLPKMHGHRHFASGISKISLWSGKEWKDLEKSFLPVICGASKPRAIKAT